MPRKKETKEERIVATTDIKSEEKSGNSNIRPTTFEEYIGQEDVKNSVNIYIKSAKKRNEPLDHMLFYGPPGLGKTTIAGIIANEMGAKLHVTTGPSIEKGGDIAAILTSMDENDILFIDEIHRVNRMVEELLYPAMEDFAIDIMISGDKPKTIRLDLPKFTLIGATTRPGLLSSPLRDRFGSINRLELYKPEELAAIINRDAKILGVKVSGEAALELGKRSRGTPRIAIRLLKRVRDYLLADDAAPKCADKDFIEKVMDAVGVGENGLDKTDMRLLEAIHNTFSDGPVGLDTLAAFTGEDVATIEDVYEPFLLQEGYLMKTPKGRTLNEKGKNLFK